MSVDKAYIALHPETAHGGDRNSSCKVYDLTETANGRNQHTGGVAKFATPNFADDTADKTGVSGMVPIAQCLSTHRTVDGTVLFSLPKNRGKS